MVHQVLDSAGETDRMSDSKCSNTTAPTPTSPAMLIMPWLRLGLLLARFIDWWVEQ